MSIDSQVLLIIGGLFIFGALAIGIASFRLKDPDTIKELWQLYAVEFALVGMVVIPIYLGGITLLIACLLLALRGIWELYRIYEIPGTGTIQTASYIGASIALCITFASTTQGLTLATPSIIANTTPIISLTILIMMLLIFASTLLPQARKSINTTLPVALSGIMLPVLPLLTLITLANTHQGFLWLFFIYLTVEVNDSVAYLTGKMIGKHHPFPYLSPKKSTEGVIGGLISAGIIGTSFGVLLLDLSLLIAIGATLTIVLGGLLGDFATSAIKRARGVKDFPQIHGFHGGALDIHDAFLFAVPSFYVYYWFIIQ